MASIDRQLHRRMLHEGRMSRTAYRKLRRSVDLDARDDAVNAPIRRHAALLDEALRWLTTSGPRIRIQNERDQLRLRIVSYHPTKGFRTQRGDPVEVSK